MAEALSPIAERAFTLIGEIVDGCAAADRIEMACALVAASAAKLTIVAGRKASSEGLYRIADDVVSGAGGFTDG